MNIEQEIKKRAKEIIKLRRRLFVIQFISKSRHSVNKNVKNLVYQDLPFIHGKRNMIWKGKKA